jgi:hypothetical protein
MRQERNAEMNFLPVKYTQVHSILLAAETVIA